MKKLITSICMLCLAAALFGTSTFAWFSMNTQVTATGMQVTAKAPTSLLISNNSATTGFGSTVALVNDTPDAASEFAPVAYADVCTSWYKLTAKGMADINESGRANNFTEVADGQPAATFTSTVIDTEAVYATASDMVFHDTVWLKVEGETSKNLKCSAAYVDDPAVTDKIKDAMHVVFVVGGAVKDTLDMGGTGVKTETTANLATLVANADATQVDIYYFLSGNDVDSMNKNITADRTMSIDLTFTAVDIPTP